MTILICLFIVGWVAAALIGTQAYFRGEQTKPIHERNWNSKEFEQLASSITGLVLTDFVVNQFLGVFDHSLNWQSANCAASCYGIEIH